MQLEVSDLVFSYGEADVLKSVSFCADRGERIAVLGPNGVGKSTLFRCLLGFLKPKRGSVKIAGRDVRDYSRRALAAELAYIPQSYSPAFDHTVLDSVLMGLGAQLGPFDSPSREQTNAAQRILDELGIGALASRGCMRISGGERQLMLLGRALIQNAHIRKPPPPTQGATRRRVLTMATASASCSALKRCRRVATASFFPRTSRIRPSVMRQRYWR